MQTASATRGRARSENSRQAILSAAVQIIGADGYGALSIERIARESGTGKQTIYRWWPTKADVVMEALLRKVELNIPIPDNGTLKADLTEFLATSLRVARMPHVPELLRALAAEAQLDAEFAHRFRDTFIENRRTALTTILARHQPDGGGDSSMRTSTLVDVVFGVIWYRLLILPTADDYDTLADELTALVVAGSDL
jgi:AcrR family transcriptional regulator